MNKKAQSSTKILMGFIILMVGLIGILFWGFGYILNNLNAIWLGRLVLSALTLAVLFIERFLR